MIFDQNIPEGLFYISIEASLVVADGEIDIQITLGASDSDAYGFYVKGTVSSASNVKDYTGPTLTRSSKYYHVASTKYGSLYVGKSAGITPSGNVMASVCLFFGYQRRPREESTTVSWTW